HSAFGMAHAIAGPRLLRACAASAGDGWTAHRDDAEPRDGASAGAAAQSLRIAGGAGPFPVPGGLPAAAEVFRRTSGAHRLACTGTGARRAAEGACLRRFGSGALLVAGQIPRADSATITKGLRVGSGAAARRVLPARAGGRRSPQSGRHDPRTVREP